MLRSAAIAKAIALALLCFCGPASAQAPLKIFDAHLHYNWEPKPYFQLDQVLELFRRNGVAGILATSRPNDGTRALVDAKPPGLWVVPFIRPYRTRPDIQTWFNEPAIFELVQEEYKRGYYKGIGEFHIYGKTAGTEWVKKIVNFAVEHDLYLHAHCDEEALLILFGHNPRAKIIWAHTGFTTSPQRVEQLLKDYPALTGELSYRSGITEGGGKISSAWRDLFARNSKRFLIGSDTWVNERWASYDNLMKEYRAWLAQIPRDQAENIAYRNAETMFGGKLTD
ncbi:hypothetical protein GJW-30_1_03476 [Variibacter gotjawalensis]|uniref:Amidohydrolase n=1 Tax=Variibacter gotjawalensis TaxID=1333996 RepID=A0A0S3PYF1_9BRAD|nr:amidohydrolase [Variibacter gotjawalensis]NIK46762.1 hypothetical protein [Variibacter gotjawalensis]RZS48666.1 hypothetical protein EV661_1081 [Variibacter gotjawalensis]BAT60926.1 hypothetical protein GJW-30_1_03476 [Variibacter gotjawalensis]